MDDTAYFFESMRLLQDVVDEVPPPKWQLIFMSILMVIMFAFLIADRVAPDHVFVTALAFCMASGIVDSKEGLKGFANEGVLTVMVSEKMRCILERRCWILWYLSPHQNILLLLLYYRFYLLWPMV
jgi:hypothetical protein